MLDRITVYDAYKRESKCGRILTTSEASERYVDARGCLNQLFNVSVDLNFFQNEMSGRMAGQTLTKFGGMFRKI